MTKHVLASLPLIAVAFLLTDARLSSASIVFDNGNHIGDWRMSGSGNRAADDFLLPTTTTITDVHWKGIYLTGVASGPDNFAIRIYADNGGVPTPLGMHIYEEIVGGANRVATGETTLGIYTVYEYSTFISPFIATGGVSYWLEIYNNASSNPWAWSMDPDVGNGVSTLFTGTWQTVGDEYTFQLTDDGTGGAAPEAGSLAIWGIVFALGFIVRKRGIFGGR
jgi:hypothetical protein